MPHLLQELNPLPFALMVAATLACTVYACVISDLLLFVTNFPGLLMSIFYVASCTPYASHRVRAEGALCRVVSGCQCAPALRALPLKLQQCTHPAMPPRWPGCWAAG